ADTSLKQVQTQIDEEGLSRYITLLPGLFEKTLLEIPQDRAFFFVNIDCDLYKPHLECLDFFYPRMEKGGIIFFDDYHSVHYPMARKAIDKFMKSRSESIYHLRFGPELPNHTKAFIIKD
ncbi:MAG: class I SAM-dependent methyltransferase, partial [Leptolyngbya sp. SIO3F4]|nr:class I SAM-dependent methyltransferase [Leptolyngbya sp. SIO3F4]